MRQLAIAIALDETTTVRHIGSIETRREQMTTTKGYLVTAVHEEAIRIQTFTYPSIKAAEADCKKHGWKIQAVQKIK